MGILNWLRAICCHVARVISEKGNHRECLAFVVMRVLSAQGQSAVLRPASSRERGRTPACLHCPLLWGRPCGAVFRGWQVVFSWGEHCCDSSRILPSVPPYKPFHHFGRTSVDRSLSLGLLLQKLCCFFIACLLPLSASSLFASGSLICMPLLKLGSTALVVAMSVGQVTGNRNLGVARASALTYCSHIGGKGVIML